MRLLVPEAYWSERTVVFGLILLSRNISFNISLFCHIIFYIGCSLTHRQKKIYIYMQVRLELYNLCVLSCRRREDVKDVVVHLSAHSGIATGNKLSLIHTCGSTESFFMPDSYFHTTPNFIRAGDRHRNFQFPFARDCEDCPV